MKPDVCDRAAPRMRPAPRSGLYNPGVPFRHAMLLLLWGLGAGSAAADTPVTVTGGGPAAGSDPHAQLRTILEQPLYQRWKLRQQRAEPGRHSSALGDFIRDTLESIRSTVGDFFRRLFRGWTMPDLPSWGTLSSLGFILQTVAWCILAVLVGFLALLIYRAVVDRGPRVRHGRVLSRKEVRQALEEGEALALNSTEWLDEARRLSSRHEFRALYRALYLALLSGLHEVGKIEYRRQRTNWTYVARFRGPASQCNVFRELTQLFDDVWYGLKPPGTANVDVVRGQIQQLIGEAPDVPGAEG
jgi:hypothetical protein